MSVPSEDKWKSIGDELYERQNFPSCIGAIDGKHVMIQWPEFTGQAWLADQKCQTKMSSFCLKRWSAI